MMKENITSREMTEMAVIVLLKGKKSMTAVREKDGQLVLKNRSILVQFLHPDYKRNTPERTKLTRQIAEALTLTFEYYLNDDEKESSDICARAILFIYVISGVDLTWLYTESNKKVQLLNLADALFHAFQGKESISRSELQNLVYEYAFGADWHIEAEPVNIPHTDYVNILLRYISYYMAREQLNGLGKEDVFRKYYNFYDFDEDMTHEEYCEEQIKNVDNFFKWIKNFVQFVDDLLRADSLEDFKSQHPGINYQPYFDIIIITDTNIKWKSYILMNNICITDFQDALEPMFSALCFTNRYHIAHAHLSAIFRQLHQFEISCHQSVNKILIENHILKKVQQTLESYISYLRLQVRVNMELGTFGSCHDQMNSVSRQMQDTCSFIEMMIEYLFYGTKGKAGKVD